MAAAREDPDVAFEVRQKLDVDARLVAGNVIAQRGHGVFRRAAACRRRAADCARRWRRCRNRPRRFRRWCATASRDAPREISSDARLFDLRAGVLGALEQHAVQVEARIDQQRLVEFQRDFARFGRGQHGFGDQPLGRGVLDQERILAVGLIGEAAAAGLLPGELFVEQLHARPADASCSAANAPAGPPPRMATRFILFLPAGGRSCGEGILPPPPAGRHAPPCGLSAPGARRRHGAAMRIAARSQPASLPWPTTTHLLFCCSR